MSISNRGTASMSPEERKRISALGGKAVRPENRSFSRNRELAAVAGKKGGKSMKPEQRMFSRNRELAALAGKKGGTARAANARARKRVQDAIEQ